MSSDDNIAIRVSNLSKCYQIYSQPQDRLKQSIYPRLQRIAGKAPQQYFREFWALKDVSFEIKKGETVGIIGRNGSGKSTLLQMICGTLNPTIGSIQTNGRIAALLELGSGFNPEFTGRENVYMNASVLGLSNEEINDRFEAIVAFAELDDFIEQPVNTYSSGMYVRLAYAVVAHVDAAILIVDEALAVGDVFFQQKCMRHLRSFQNNGGTVMFVSHDTTAVTSLCNKAILLSHGVIAAAGKTDEICQAYVENIYAERASIIETDRRIIVESQRNESIQTRSEKLSESIFEGGEQPANMFRVSPFLKNADSFGQGGVTIVDIWFGDISGTKIEVIRGGEQTSFCMIVKANQEISHPAFGFMFKDRLGQYVIAEGTDMAFRHCAFNFKVGNTAIIRFSFVMPVLIQGEYTLNVAVAEGMGDDHVQHHWINDAMVLHSLQSRLVHGICGLQNLAMEIRIVSKY